MSDVYGIALISFDAEEKPQHWKKIVFEGDTYIRLTPVSRNEIPVREGVIYADKDDGHLYIFLGGTWKQIV